MHLLLLNLQQISYFDYLIFNLSFYLDINLNIVFIDLNSYLQTYVTQIN